MTLISPRSRYGSDMTSSTNVQKPTLDTMAAAYAAVVAERQLAFDELVGPVPWSADLSVPSLTLGDRTFTAALLGSAADEDQSWLWSWANPAFGENHPAAAAIVQLRTLGERFDVPELTKPKLPLSSISDSGMGPAHTLAVAGAGVLGAGAYYAGGYDGGSAFLLITDPSLHAPAFDASKVPGIIGAAVQAFPHDHRLTIETYLGHHKLPTERLKNGLLAYIPDNGGILAFTFDEHDRLIDMELETA